MRLFGENEEYTVHGLELADRIENAVRPIFDEFRARGFNLRDIGYVASISVTSEHLALIMDAQAQKASERTKERRKRQGFKD